MGPNKELFFSIFNSIDFHKIIDHPNILIAARFWEEERYDAAKTCYRLMRSIDDLIDDYKAEHRIIRPEERESFSREVNNWINMIRDNTEKHAFQKELAGCISKFKMPLWPLEDFAKSMLYDIDHSGFSTLSDFIEYSRGASVAPASIFVHLNSISRKNGNYMAPPFDVREAATPCAMFSYFVHIIRDFQKDQRNNLNYFADDLIKANNLTGELINKIAHGAKPGLDFRNLVKVYYDHADEYRQKTIEMIGRIAPLLEPRYQLSLDIIFNLYLMVFERIDIEKGNFTTEELNPTPEEAKERVYNTIVKFTEHL
jgi:phytoene/squalene synthetase